MTALLCHPETPSAAVQGIEARASRSAPDRLAVAYRIRGELDRLRIPAPRAPTEGVRLWQHTCCELFVCRGPGGEYQEFNFSPSGEWAAYGFRSYRQGAPLTAADPGIRVLRSDGGLQLDASVPVAPGRLFVALCAVIEEQDGRLSYWSLRHPAGKPDFHRRESFALELE